MHCCHEIITQAGLLAFCRWSFVLPAESHFTLLIDQPRINGRSQNCAHLMVIAPTCISNWFIVIKIIRIVWFIKLSNHFICIWSMPTFPTVVNIIIIDKHLIKYIHIEYCDPMFYWRYFFYFLNISQTHYTGSCQFHNRTKHVDSFIVQILNWQILCIWYLHWRWLCMISTKYMHTRQTGNAQFHN